VSTDIPPALVLTAGMGTRLAPLNMLCAKPAVPVAGIPLVRRILNWLTAQGVSSAVLNLHHKPETITRYVGHGTESKLTIRYSWEPTILGTAGGPRRALELLGKRFFVINGDTLTNVDLQALIRTHESSGADVTLALIPNPAPHRYGGVIVDNDGWVSGFTPAGPSAVHHFVGVQLIESSVFMSLKDGDPAASIGGIYDTLTKRNKRAIRAHRISGSFYDIGNPADYLKTSLSIAEAEGLGTIPVGRGSNIHQTASLIRTIVWNDVVIEADCCLIDCIVGDHVRLPRNSKYKSQVIIPSDGRMPTGPESRHGDLLLLPFDAE